MTPQFILSTLKCNSATPKALKLHLQSIKLQKSFNLFFKFLFIYMRGDVVIHKMSGFFVSTILIIVKIESLWNTVVHIYQLQHIIDLFQGVKFLRRFKQLMNPAQVFDLMNGGPYTGIRLFQKFDPFRILVCGGDGSVGWVFQEMDKLKLHNQVNKSCCFPEHDTYPSCFSPPRIINGY
jgi:hypothetical protein